MKLTDKAWAAGTFESRGSIIINKSGSNFHLRCMVVGIDKSILEFFQAQWPGSMIPISRPRDSQPQRKWVVTGNAAASFLNDISPLFKTAQALAKTKLALEFQEHKANGGDYTTQLAYHEKLGAINSYKRRGVR